jgi:hypothetical protein
MRVAGLWIVCASDVTAVLTACVAFGFGGGGFGLGVALVAGRD